jgi:hypothetical protein
LKIDELVLILSTDWFLPYWQEIGLHLNIETRIAVQQGCREVVSHILGDAEDYFHCDHSSERMQETASRFRGLMQDLNVERDFQTTYAEWFALSHQELTASFCYSLVTRELVRGSGGNEPLSLDSPAIAAIQESWVDPESNADAYLDLCWKSMTDWDAHSRNIMGSPTALSSTLKSVFRHKRFMAFSVRLRSRLSKSQREELTSWYREQRNSRFNRRA